jgi:hypothetical protein
MSWIEEAPSDVTYMWRNQKKYVWVLFALGKVIL